MSGADVAFYAARPRSRLAAGALITDGRGDVLLVEPTYKANWEVPGGGVEAHESAPAACRRECREELGLDLAVGRLLVVDHQLDPPPRGDAIMFLYEGGVLEDPTGITLQRSELRSYRFVAPAEIDALVIPRLARRIRGALRARRDGGVVELTEDPSGPG